MWPNLALMRGGRAANERNGNLAAGATALANGNKHAYQARHPGNIPSGSFLAGAKSFGAEEIEVYQLQHEDDEDNEQEEEEELEDEENEEIEDAEEEEEEV